jgi:hypothetical protein
MFTNSLIAISRPWVSKVIHGIAIMLLTGCLVLNLILLLLPTSSLHLSVFSIEPTGKQLVAKTPTPTNNETITLFPNVSIGAYEGLNKEPVNRTAIVEAPKFWMGIDGPSIWVGAMSECLPARGKATWALEARADIGITLGICSKRSDKGDVSCTSASRASERKWRDIEASAATADTLGRLYQFTLYSLRQLGGHANESTSAHPSRRGRLMPHSRPRGVPWQSHLPMSSIRHVPRTIAVQPTPPSAKILHAKPPSYHDEHGFHYHLGQSVFRCQHPSTQVSRLADRGICLDLRRIRAITCCNCY